jgi:predicted nucleotidyltransferase
MGAAWRKCAAGRVSVNSRILFRRHIDVLVDFMPESTIDLVDYAGLMLDLTQLACRRVDLVSKKGLKPLVRTSVLNEARPLYAA